MSEARSPRVIDACVGYRAIFGRQLQIGQPRVDRRHPPPQVGARLERVRLGVHLLRAGEIAARVEYLADADSRRRIGGIHFDHALVSRERLIGLSLLGLDIGEVAHQERAVGRCRNGLLVQARGFVEAIRLRGPPGGRHVLLLRAGAQHFDAARDRLQLPDRA